MKVYDFAAIEKMRQIRSLELVAAVPPELKAQFDQMQLKNSIYRLKLLGVIIAVINALNWPVYMLHFDEIGITLLRKMFVTHLCLLFITLMFFIMTSHFSKKSNGFILWLLCYFFIILHFLLWAYTMLFVEILPILQGFFICSFFCTFIPDFKPKIFISLLILWYLAFVGLLTYNSFSFEVRGPQIFALNIFFTALVLRILQYNDKVKTFINLFKISALNEKLEALSTTDELTKLNNRRSFVEYMDIVWKQNHRLNLPVTVLMIDADYFKKYNDSMGHLEGDKALIAIAQCMKNHVKRETDFIARFGGEEFVCLLPFIEKDEAIGFAETLVANIENMQISHPMSEVSKYITVSIGMASAIPGNHNSPTQLLDEADKALYMAKKSGRNRVVA